MLTGKVIDLGGEQHYINTIYEEVERIGVVKIFKEKWEKRAADAAEFTRNDSEDW